MGGYLVYSVACCLVALNSFQRQERVNLFRSSHMEPNEGP